jgi:outer membrane protein OmpA-like peptidoglycan-associated protein
MKSLCTLFVVILGINYCLAQQTRGDLRYNNNSIIKPTGKYYALLIGVERYENANLNLRKPIQDVKDLRKVLIERYTFDSNDVIVLENPTRNDVLNTLYKLRNLTTNDNLLIFYAGHGYYDEKIKQGYWWPKDVQVEFNSNSISNSDIKESIKAINSAHTLVITDACFGGSLTRDASAIKNADMGLQLLYKYPSRQVMTSTTLKAVPDESQFLLYLLKRLSENQEQFLPAGELFNSLKVAVTSNSGSIPQFEAIKDTGHEGGDFIFISKSQPVIIKEDIVDNSLTSENNKLRENQSTISNQSETKESEFVFNNFGYDEADNEFLRRQKLFSEGILSASDWEIAKQEYANSKKIKPIYFDKGETSPRMQSFPELSKVIQYCYLTKNAITLKAHTDNNCSGSKCRELSEAYAKSIVDYLINNHVPKASILIELYGASKPIDTNDTEEGRANNRRVEIEFSAHR